MRSTPTFYFSFRSPYSWLAYHDLTKKHFEYVNELRWQPFWEPNDRYQEWLNSHEQTFPYVPMSRAKHLYMLHDVRRQASARGLTNAWPTDNDPNWEVSHLPWYVANARGYGQEYIAAVYRARWLDGANIHDPNTIDDITTKLTPEAFPSFAEIADDPVIQDLAQSTLQEIWRNDVFGVPYFMGGRHRFWGIDRLEDFLTSLSSAGSPITRDDRPGRPSCVEAPPGADPGHEGGCG